MAIFELTIPTLFCADSHDGLKNSRSTGDGGVFQRRLTVSGTY
ncbi:hypothetical protein AXFE_15870 [Acidithrix ferrooxidans]|uniref:Uncharacterized protein n=1 Tax=Acidithrix ferrooxidans TaxID=1280514 RepID=A0A0D8HHY2_9ACTN|nr:hypothetical protein AXFE_15870 [Acidithrix ferrooxidans]